MNNTCCFFGHRTIKEIEELRTKITEAVEKLISDENVDTFLFGSKSEFDRLCLELVTKLKEKHPHIKRIYVRAEFPYINDAYLTYLLKSYDETYYPEKLHGAGRAAYVERNCEMTIRANTASSVTTKLMLPPPEKAPRKLSSITLSKSVEKSSLYN